MDQHWTFTTPTEQRASERATDRPTDSSMSSNMFFRASSVRSILVLALLQREAALLATALRNLQQCLMHAIESKSSSVAAKPRETSSAPAVMDASANRSSNPIETNGVEEIALEATKEHTVKMERWRQAAALAVQDNFCMS